MHGVCGQVEHEGLCAEQQLNPLLRAAIGQHDDKAAVGIAEAGVRDGSAAPSAAFSPIPFVSKTLAPRRMCLE